jgi:hypothetical protein
MDLKTGHDSGSDRTVILKHLIAEHMAFEVLDGGDNIILKRKLCAYFYFKKKLFYFFNNIAIQL